MKSEAVIINRIERLKKARNRFLGENMEQRAHDVQQLILELSWVIQPYKEKENG